LIDVHIIASIEPIVGVRETGVPLVIPGLANAIAALVGVRVHTLPLKKYERR
jgi:CO/xanthine dehydrogenase Mo-binding subunit